MLTSNIKFDSLRFQREALQSGVAAKLAAYLEKNIEPKAYDFIAPDILEIDIGTLKYLRSSCQTWEDLEKEYRATSGSIVEMDDFDLEEIEVIPQLEEKNKKKTVAIRAINKLTSRYVGLIIITLGISMIFGTIFGWNCPQFQCFQDTMEQTK